MPSGSKSDTDSRSKHRSSCIALIDAGKAAKLDRVAKLIMIGSHRLRSTPRGLRNPLRNQITRVDITKSTPPTSQNSTVNLSIAEKISTPTLATWVAIRQTRANGRPYSDHATSRWKASRTDSMMLMMRSDASDRILPRAMPKMIEKKTIWSAKPWYRAWKMLGGTSIRRKFQKSTWWTAGSLDGSDRLTSRTFRSFWLMS